MACSATQAGRRRHRIPVPVIGLTGTGGSGKSSLTDELVRRFVYDFPDKRVAVISVDPTRRRTGGALLGDRIRFNSLKNPRRLHALAGHARRAAELSAAISDAIDVLPAPRLRPDLRRDRGHRPGRQRDHRSRRRLALRDDRRIRRAEPARKDRDAGLRRLRRDQQVRAPRQRGRAARRAQAVPAQPQAVRPRPRRACRSSAPAPRNSTTAASTRSTRTSSPSSTRSSAWAGSSHHRLAPSASRTSRSTSSRRCASATCAEIAAAPAATTSAGRASRRTWPPTWTPCAARSRCWAASARDWKPYEPRRRPPRCRRPADLMDAVQPSAGRLDAARLQLLRD